MRNMMQGLGVLLLGWIGLCHVAGVHQPVIPKATSPPTPIPAVPNPVLQPNCTLKQTTPPPQSMLVDFKLLAGSNSHNLPLFPSQQSKDPNCTVPVEGVKVLVNNEDQWKTHVIIACTVTATVEVSIVVFIMLYWRQIRWTMRKLACPCTQRRRRSSQHHRVSTSDPDDTTDMDPAHEDGEIVSDPEPVPSTSAAAQMATSQV